MTVLTRRQAAEIYLPGGEAASNTAYEASRNNANGTTGADILAPKAPTIRNVTITGTAVLGPRSAKAAEKYVAMGPSGTGSIRFIAVTAGLAGNLIDVYTGASSTPSVDTTTDPGNVILNCEFGVTLVSDMVDLINAAGCSIIAEVYVAGTMGEIPNGTPLSGGLDNDCPDPADVRETATTHQVQGEIPQNNIDVDSGGTEVRAPAATSTPGTWSISDSGDGQSWTLAVEGSWPDGTMFVLVGQNVATPGAWTFRASCISTNLKVRGLLPTERYALYAQAPGLLISSPSDDYRVPDALVANYSAGAGNIMVGSADRVDGTVTNGTNPGGGGTAPTTPGWAAEATATSTGARLHFTAASAGDTMKARFRRRKTADAWIEATETRTGTGALDIALPSRADWEIQGYAYKSGLVSIPIADPQIVTAPASTYLRCSSQEAVFWILSHDADFMALCAGRLFPDMAPQGVARKGPYATYHNPGGTPTDHLLGPSGLSFDIIQINHVANSSREAQALAGAARLALLGWSGDVILDDGRMLVNTKIRLLERHDEFDNPVGGSGRGVHRELQDWQISYAEELPTA